MEAVRALARFLVRLAAFRCWRIDHAVVERRVQWAVMSRHWLAWRWRFEGARGNRLEAVQLARRLRAAK